MCPGQFVSVQLQYADGCLEEEIVGCSACLVSSCTKYSSGVDGPFF